MKLWFCFWWGTVTGSLHVLHSLPWCVNIKTFKHLSWWFILDSGINFEWLGCYYFLFGKSAVSRRCLVSVIYFLCICVRKLQPWPVGCYGPEHRCLFQQEEMSKFINLILIKHSLHIVLLIIQIMFQKKLVSECWLRDSCILKNISAFEWNWAFTYC